VGVLSKGGEQEKFFRQQSIIAEWGARERQYCILWIWQIMKAMGIQYFLSGKVLLRPKWLEKGYNKGRLVLRVHMGYIFDSYADYPVLPVTGRTYQQTRYQQSYHYGNCDC